MKKLIEYIKLHGKARIDNVKKFLWSKEIEDTLLKCNLTLQELCYRLKNNIPLDKVFLCPICNNPVKFVSGHGYQTYCNVECQKKDAGTKLNENFLKQYNIVYKSDDYYKLLKDYDLDFYQLAYRLRREIPLDKKFTCKVCGKPAIFNKGSGYSNGCCRSHIAILLNKNPSVINKSIETCMKKYGSKSYVESKSYKNRYNEIQNKIKSTFNKNYGVDNYAHSDLCKSRTKQTQQKRYETLTKNKTWNTSKPEKEVGRLLKLKFKDVRPQYKSEKYPFACDYYVGDIDTYIECNFTWTHGIYKGKVLKYFNPKNKFHKRVLEEWKAENTKFYRNAIYTWTKLDPLKQKTARKNKLNYKVFWYNDLSDFNEWYNGLTV